MRVMLVSVSGFQYLAAVMPAMEEQGVAYRRLATTSLDGQPSASWPAAVRRYAFGRRLIADYRKQIEAFRPDLVHVMGVRPTVIMTLAAMRPYPTVGLVHERISAGGMNVFSPLDPVLFRRRRIDRIIMPSRSMLNNWMGSRYTRWLAAPRRNEVLHYAFRLPDPTSPEDKRALRQDLGLNPDAFVIGTVCHIRPWKAVEFVADIVRSLEVDRRVEFAVVGGWNPKSNYIRRIRETGGDRLRLLGHVPEAHRIMAAFDLYVTPTLLPGESFGMAFAEAMAHGVPGITMNYGASAEVCDHGFTGYALPENQSVWRRHIVELIEDDALRNAMGRAARTRIADRFSPDVRARDYLRVYRTVIEERGGWNNGQ